VTIPLAAAKDKRSLYSTYQYIYALCFNESIWFYPTRTKHLTSKTL